MHLKRVFSAVIAQVALTAFPETICPQVQSTQDGQVDAAQPAMIQWYGFKMVHPTVVGQFMDLTDCVLCGSCTAACPSYWWNNDIFLGPAAMVQAWYAPVSVLNNAAELSRGRGAVESAPALMLMLMHLVLLECGPVQPCRVSFVPLAWFQAVALGATQRQRDL